MWHYPWYYIRRELETSWTCWSWEGASAVGAPLDGLGAPIEELDFAIADGRRFFRVGMGPVARSTGHGVATVPRDAIVARLAASLPPGVLEHGASVTSVDVDPGGRAVVTDASGTAREADVVVGADGIASTVRAACPGLPPAAGTGWGTWQAMTRVLPTIAAGTSGRYLVGNAGFVGMMPAGDGLVLWWFDVPHAEGDARPASPAAWLRQRFAGYADPVPELLESVDDDVLRFYPHTHLPLTQVWGRGPLTLLGDAAHGFPPSQAQGANQALEDAWSLTHALSGTSDAPAALRRYERTRARRLRRIARMAASEITERAPLPARWAAKLVPSAVASRIYVHQLRSFSSVLNDERP